MSKAWSKVPPVAKHNCKHLRKADLAQFGAKFRTGKYFLLVFVFGQNQKSGEELSNGPVVLSRTAKVTGTYCSLWESPYRTSLCEDF